MDAGGRATHSFVSAGTRFLIDERYELIKPIGHGAYGVVVSARDTATGGKVAIKKIPCVFDDAVDAKRVLREIKLLRHFRHDNIIGLLDLQSPPTNVRATLAARAADVAFSTVRRSLTALPPAHARQVLSEFVDIYMVFELLETDMQRVISSRQVLSEDHIKYFVYQLLRGVKGLHSAGVIHRDLKPSNLLLNADCDLKVCDLGLARGITQSERSASADLTPSSKTGEDDGAVGEDGMDEDGEPVSEMLTEYVVTRWYRAPEIMLSCSEYTRAVDMWAVGCIITELYLRKTLFPGKDYIHQLRLIAGVIGTPADAELDFVKSNKARRFMSEMRRKEPRDIGEMLPGASADAIDMIQRLLVWNPQNVSILFCLFVFFVVSLTLFLLLATTLFSLLVEPAPANECSRGAAPPVYVAAERMRRGTRCAGLRVGGGEHRPGERRFAHVDLQRDSWPPPRVPPCGALARGARADPRRRNSVSALKKLSN